MKKKLFIFLLMLFILPFGVKAEEFYFNHGEYRYSTQPLEQTKDLEVEVIYGEEETLYKYRTRDYLILPYPLIIYSKNFDILSVFDTNLPLEDFDIIPHYDFAHMNHCHSYVEILYGGTKIHKNVYISIDNYIDIPKEIIVQNKEFDIWKYIETDVADIENIEFIGQYDLEKNGEYEILIKYNNIQEKTKIIVDIVKADTEDEEKTNVEENIDDTISKENEEIQKDESKIIKTEILNTYVNNYYELKRPEGKIEYIEKAVPVPTKIICEKTADNQVFNYVTYVFYGIVIILLSIIVVRKK